MSLALMVLLAVPEQALLQKLGERALQLEHFNKASKVTVDIVAEELDSDGKVTKTTHTALRVARDGAKSERKLLTFVENGKDLTAAKRAELESAPKKETQVRSPFHPDERAKYQFTVLAADQPASMRIGFEPSGEKTSELYVGEATVDPQTGDVLAVTLRPSKNPPFVQSLSIESKLDAVTPAGRATSSLTLSGVGGFLFIKQRFRVLTTFKDYEPL